MEFFQKAQTIRLRSYNDKYLIAEEDEENVIQDRDGTTKNSLWTVEFVLERRNVIRLKSCYGKYLTATNVPFPPKVTGKKVIQSLLAEKDNEKDDFDQRTEWEPIRDGFQVRLKTVFGDYLRPNGGLPPWRNTIIHDVPHWSKTLDKILWDVEVVKTTGTPLF